MPHDTSCRDLVQEVLPRNPSRDMFSRERERERKRERERHRQRQIEKEREREIEKERTRERERGRESSYLEILYRLSARGPHSQILCRDLLKRAEVLL